MLDGAVEVDASADETEDILVVVINGDDVAFWDEGAWLESPLSWFEDGELEEDSELRVSAVGVGDGLGAFVVSEGKALAAVSCRI